MDRHVFFVYNRPTENQIITSTGPWRDWVLVCYETNKGVKALHPFQIYGFFHNLVCSRNNRIVQTQPLHGEMVTETPHEGGGHAEHARPAFEIKYIPYCSEI